MKTKTVPFLLTLIFAITLVLAVKNTIVTGTVWNYNHTIKIVNATVTTTCNNINHTGVTSGSGTFAIGYPAAEGCGINSNVSVYAQLDNLSGQTSAIVHDFGTSTYMAISSVNIA